MNDSLSVKEQLAQMINGTHVNAEVEDEEQTDVIQDSEVEPTVDTSDTTVTTDEDDSTDIAIEDTDQDASPVDDDDTNEENDGSTQETSEDAEKAQEEHTHAEEVKSEEDTDVAEEINYKEFYEKVALAKFTANGREVEGFKNPEDLIRAQQMLHGYSDKMKVFKEYKKFLKPLEERGVIADPDKFNLAMSLLDGDPEAIKKVLKDKNIDPLEFDLDNIQYVPRVKLPSEAQLLIEENFEQAENLGIGDKFNKVISRDWDIPSLQEFVNNSAVRADLMQHLQDGTYDIVQNEIKRMELLDTTGVLDGMSSVQKYRAAVGRLQKTTSTASVTVPKVPVAPVIDKVAETKKAEEEAEFKRKAAEKELERNEQRKKAASMSKKKVVSAPKPAPKPEELKGEDFRKAFKQMLME